MLSVKHNTSDALWSAGFLFRLSLKSSLHSQNTSVVEVLTCTSVKVNTLQYENTPILILILLASTEILNKGSAKCKSTCYVGTIISFD